ncbi:hypothetical protein RN001_000163 [Aquatica leii]|uniref:DNA replication complex GINS protein PSF3 n=1 Tax=Aquatica leii TaxID=1421715 RepID=A0AAN7SJ24_9COLE|nr:hypothetical protein RN001_000163 [Aquatica leii]
MSLSQSYKPNYFSIEDILVTQERVPCKFLINVPKLGKLNPATEDLDIKPGTILELPMWLAEPISSGRQPLISIDLPRSYKETHREILKADAVAVDLHKFGINFYELGLYVKHLDPTGEVLKVLLHTFQSRFRLLMDLTENVGSDPTVQNRLDMLERMLFKSGHAARMRLDTWLRKSDLPMEAAAMVVNHKKRKRIDLEDLFKK